MGRERILLLDYWIAFLMILVILGHFAFPFAPAWYEKWHAWLYSFHMGAFFFASGYLVKYTYRELTCRHDYFRYVGRKLKKFGIPFLFFGISLTAFAIWREGGSCRDYLLALQKLFIDPMSSKVLYLWFIYILFFYYVLAPLFCQFGCVGIACGAIAGLVLSFCPMPRLFAMHCFARYLIFFVAGIIACCHIRQLARIPVWAALGAVPFFVLCSLVPGEILYLYSGMSSLPCLFLLCFCLARVGWFRNLAELISKNCFGIYLFQMIFIHILAFAFGRLPQNSFTFLFFMFSGLCFAVWGSVWAVRLITAIADRLKKRDEACA